VAKATSATLLGAQNRESLEQAAKEPASKGAISRLDVDRVRDWGAAAVVTLLEPKELALLKVERLGGNIAPEYVVVPSSNRWVSIPDERFEKEWNVAGEGLRSMLRRRLDVLVHCRGGLGRAGTIAARLLIELGMEPTSD
jgi:ADP-ribosyl-[dinitrogen reductase] hydrolase